MSHFSLKARGFEEPEGEVSSLGVSGAATPGATPEKAVQKVHGLFCLGGVPPLSALIREPPTFSTPP